MSEALDRLARAAGITDGYWEINGTEHRTSAATKEALLAAMGLDARDESACRRSLEELAERTPHPLAEHADSAHIDYGDVPRGFALEEALGDARGFGVYANLYTLRGGSLCGIGDFGDLEALVTAAAAEGADFVALNPLHVLRIDGADACPYSPTSRLFVEPLYLDAAALGADDAGECIDDGVLATLRRSASLDYGAAWAAARPLLARAFARWRGRPEAAAALAEFRGREGGALQDFALFRTAAEILDEGRGADWRRWPAPLRNRHHEALAELERERADDVALHCWLAMLTDARLGDISAKAGRAGMRIGLLLDLALGNPAQSCDVWSHPGAFVHGARLGAPPDELGPDGQNWDLLPLAPAAMSGEAGRYQQRLYERVMRHAGGMRLDHSMALVRQFWIPEGATGADGAYVLYPPALSMNLLAEAARANRCLVVAEDLGTVPDGFRQWLSAAATLRTAVLYFERDGEDFTPPSRWPAEALATANTHDLPTLPGWLVAADADARPMTDAAREALRAQRAGDVEKLHQRLVAEGLLAHDEVPDTRRWVEAAAALLGGSASRLVALSLDDLGHELAAINVPGLTSDVRRSWSRRMQRPLADLLACEDFRAPMRACATHRSSPSA